MCGPQESELGHGVGDIIVGPWDVRRMVERARGALLVAAGAREVLTPRDVAGVVARALPDATGRSLFGALEALDWLGPRAVIAFDAVEGARCPARLRPFPRELVRLAVFGLPGQGLSSRDKHRQAVYQRLCAELMSSAIDEQSLATAAKRVMNHTDVRGDGMLASMLRSFIAQREAALRSSRATPDQTYHAESERSKLTHAFGGAGPAEAPSREDVQHIWQRMQREYEGYLAQFEESYAHDMLVKLRQMRHRFPGFIRAVDLQECEEKFDRLSVRAGQYRRQIEELALRGAEGALEGDERTAAWVIRRLHAIHTLLPNLLPLTEFKGLREQITRSSVTHESEEAARELIERQQEVMRKIKHLASAIHRFHEVSRRYARESNTYRRAELNYQAALQDIRSMDTDWLTSLVIELEGLLEDLDDPGEQMQSRLDGFIATVRDALNRLCREVRAHQKSARRTNSRKRKDGDGGDVPAQPA